MPASDGPGYYCFNLLHRIGQQGGYFISRVKSAANSTIKGANITCRGRSIDLASKPLQSVIGRLKRHVIDVMVELDVKMGTNGGIQSVRPDRLG